MFKVILIKVLCKKFYFFIYDWIKNLKRNKYANLFENCHILQYTNLVETTNYLFV